VHCSTIGISEMIVLRCSASDSTVLPEFFLRLVGIFLKNKFRRGKLNLSKIEGGRTLIIFLSLRRNSGGTKQFSGGGQNAPFAPPRKIPGLGYLSNFCWLKLCSYIEGI